MTRSEKLFIAFAMLSAFLICGEYAVTRPTSNALFLTQFSSKAYPWVWLFTVPLNFFAIHCYNKFLPKVGPWKILVAFALGAMGINSLTALLSPQIPILLFFQYAWKDIYVLFMLKQLWSMIHSTIPQERAKSWYGFIYASGTCGAICGSLIPGFVAVSVGSEKILFLTLPLYLLLLGVYQKALQLSGISAFSAEKLTQSPRPSVAFTLIRRSPLLIGVLLLVIFMQTSVGLMEYRFNTNLELNILQKDLRTAYCGKIASLTNLASLLLQFLGGILMVRILGLKKSHFLVPVLLTASTFLSFSIPSFALVSFSYVFLKAIDFSLFGVIREMLYVPLPLDAKFRAKAVIDVFAYRTSKAFISVTLILLQAVAGSYLLSITGYFSLAILLAWIGTVAFLFSKRTQIQFIQ